MADIKAYKLILFLIYSAAWQCTEQASLPTDSHYTAGVVEFHPTHLEDNLSAYLQIIGSPEAVTTDIIVFPEATLNNNSALTFVPDSDKELLAPCIADPDASVYHDLLVKLSCQARNVSKYVVVNLSEKENCSTVLDDPRPCAADGLNVYNTNVVFDRSGAVVSRYRKVHLYGELKNTTYLPEFGIFETDFGVRFGHFVCFDILFYTPAQAMVKELGIKDFIFTTMWFSQLPFLTGVQYHASWSYGNDVNLLAAGASNPMVGCTGSGIYNGRQGTLVSVMTTGLGERRLYVARVPKYAQSGRLQKRDFIIPRAPIDTQADNSNIFLKRDYLQQYESVVVDLKQGTSLQRDVCFNNTFCCHFELQWRFLQTTPNSTYYTYRLGAYEGFRNEVSVDPNQIRNCVIFHCMGSEDILECGKLFAADAGNVEPQVAFEQVLIEASFPVTEEYSLMPNSLKDDLLPLEPTEFQWAESLINNTHNISFRLDTSTDNLLTFAIYGNYYDGCECPATAPDNDDDGGAAAITASNLLTFATAILLTFVTRDL